MDATKAKRALEKAQRTARAHNDQRLRASQRGESSGAMTARARTPAVALDKRSRAGTHPGMTVAVARARKVVGHLPMRARHAHVGNMSAAAKALILRGMKAKIRDHKAHLAKRHAETMAKALAIPLV
jgi:hypothetical protein